MSRVAYHHPAALSLCVQNIEEALQSFPPTQPVICVCIGTDRSTGDSLGPLVGTLLTKQQTPGLTVLGTLEQPVHALNLPQAMHYVAQHPEATVIAIDACLGKPSSVGKVQIGIGPIKPGAGVNKDLPPVGQLHVTGIVNTAGAMEYFVLQNTRLHVVMEMAELIASSLHQALQRKRQRLTDVSSHNTPSLLGRVVQAQKNS